MRNVGCTADKANFVRKNIARAERHDPDRKPASDGADGDGAKRAVAASCDHCVADALPSDLGHTLGCFGGAARRELKDISTARPHDANDAIEQAWKRDAGFRIEDKCKAAAHAEKSVEYNYGGTGWCRHAS
jgi:hypothetical protein